LKGDTVTPTFYITAVSGLPSTATNPGGTTFPSANGTVVVIPTRVATSQRGAKRRHLRLVD
jgi:hypothetical protein